MSAAPVAPSDRTAEVLDAFLARATVRTERAVAVTRLVLAFLSLAQFLWFDGLGQTRAGSVGHGSILLGIAVAILWSAWTLARLHPGPGLRRHLFLSITMDGLVLFLVFFGVVALPSAAYPGILRLPDNGVFLVALATAGLRLDARVSLYAVGVFAGLEVLAVVADEWLNPGIAGYDLRELAMWVVVFAGAIFLALAMARRTRRLVREGAEAAVQAERTRQRFGLYVSEELAEEALAAAHLRVGGRRQPVAVLFSDLRSFTTYSEHSDPEALVSELNAYLDTMVRAARAHGGVVDKFIGDGIMIVFGVPRGGPGDAARAIRAAEAMQRALAEHNARRAASGLPPFAHGIGVHYGPVVAGNIGNAERLQYTVVGDAVNAASRLQGATKEVGAPVLVSAQAVEAARATGEPLPTLVPVGEVRVRGRAESLEAYRLEVEASGTGAGRRSA